MIKIIEILNKIGFKYGFDMEDFNPSQIQSNNGNYNFTKLQRNFSVNDPILVRLLSLKPLYCELPSDEVICDVIIRDYSLSKHWLSPLDIEFILSNKKRYRESFLVDEEVLIKGFAQYVRDIKIENIVGK